MLPNAKDTSNMLVSFALGDAKPQRESVEYRLRWVPNAKSLRWPCTFHVFCVDSISVGSQRKPRFQWNMGFILYIKLFIMHFSCIRTVRPCHIQEVVSQQIFGISTQFFQYSKAHDLFLDHHLCQVAPKLQSRSHIYIYTCTWTI